MGEEQSPTFEMASVLFMDIVNYSLRTIDEQTLILTKLQSAVRASAEFRNAQDRKEIISLPTGDGMALVFLRDPVSPINCALDIARALKGDPEVRLRMGVHTGPVARHADIKEEANVVGGGINMAQRVMDCGDADHILLSRNVAEVLEQFSGWRECLQDLGTHAVKHGVKVHIFNFCKDGLGNPVAPTKLAEGASIAHTSDTADDRKSLPWRSGMLIGILVASLALALSVTYKANHLGLRAPPPFSERILSYSVIVQKYRAGKPYQDAFRLTGERVFEADYRIWLIFSSPQSGYLYVLNEGPKSTNDTPDFNTLYPSLISGGSALLNPNQELRIPQGGPIVFDDQKGTEKLWLVWSQEAQPEFEALKHWTNTADRGDIRDRGQLRAIQSFLSKHSDAPVVEHNETATLLKAKGSVLVDVLKLDHD